jgi:hypothetical protein
VSGYLARLAARAGGVPAAAGPRLPSRFEPSTDDVRADAAAGVASPDTAVREELGIAVRSDVTRADGRRPRDAGAELSVPADRARERRGAEVETAAPATSTNARIEAGGALERGDSLHEPRTAAVAATPLRVEAVPPPRAAASPIAVTPREEASAAPPEPDVVHVSIGRIEVRATVAPQTSAPRVPRPPRDTERALHDYLAGRTR